MAHLAQKLCFLVHPSFTLAHAEFVTKSFPRHIGAMSVPSRHAELLRRAGSEPVLRKVREIGSEPTRRQEVKETGLEKVREIGSEPTRRRK